MAVEQLDVPRRMGQQQLDGLGFVRISGVGDEPPEAGLTQIGLVVLAVLVQPPGPGLPIQVVTTVVRDDDLLAEPVIAVLAAALVQVHRARRRTRTVQERP